MSHNTGSDRYANVNGQWPETLPKLTPQEAVAAVKRLYRFGTGKAWKGKFKLTSGRRYTWPRRGTFYVNPDRGYFGGWRDLVHEVSHYCHRRKYPNSKPHDFRHHFLEKEMINHVIASGWLDGKLKREPKPAKPKKEVKLDSVKARIKRWESKRKRADTALRKLRRTEARLSK